MELAQVEVAIGMRRVVAVLAVIVEMAVLAGIAAKLMATTVVLVRVAAAVVVAAVLIPLA